MTELARALGHCLVVYRMSSTAVWRVCACQGNGCWRTVPQPHRGIVDTTTTPDSDTPDASSDDDEPAAAPTPARVMRNVIPPPPVATPADALPFEFITRDESIEKKNELFGVSMRTERELFEALAPRESSAKAMRNLAECLVDSTSLPGKHPTRVFG
jgi:hypothetical protein